MTFEEFMYHAKHEIDDAFKDQKNRMINLVEQAWTEGKKNAEAEAIEQKATDILEALRKQISDAAEASKIYIDPPKINKYPYPINPCTPSTDPGVTHIWTEDEKENIPAGCRNCSNHPSNGGSGICHCIIGTQPIMCNSTATDICDAIEKDKISGVAYDVMTSTGSKSEVNVYNAACDNHIKIIHEMMGIKMEENEDGQI